MGHQETAGDELLATGLMLGDTRFGIDARFVQEVSKPGESTPVRNAPPGVVGIRNLRGRIITVVDLAVQLGLGAAEDGPEARLLIMENRGETYGFLVDRVTDALALEADEIEEAPSNLEPTIRGKLRGVWRDADGVTAILDPDTLFDWNDESTDSR